MKIQRSSRDRRFVVSDIHGCAQTFRHLIEQTIRLTSDDQLFLLGDFIDRGKDNAGVLDFVMELAANQYQVFPLRGNHEEMLLNAWTHYKYTNSELPGETFADHILDAFDLLDAGGELHTKYAAFMEALPYFYELDEFYLVHAGFDFRSENPFNDYSSMVWIRNFNKNPTSKTIIHGHQITPLAEIKEKIRQRHPVIPLDNGCFYGLFPQQLQLKKLQHIELGNLCALNLDTFELHLQPCIG